MRSSFVNALPLAVLTFAGCGGSTPTTTPATDAAVAADTPPPPGDSGTPAAQYPQGPYGSRIGATFEPFTLNRCDGTPWSFTGENWENSSMTVVIISAGWCVPCQREARQIQSQIVDPYVDRGVRVISVLVQDDRYMAITPTFCNRWVNTYDLQIPILMDPRFILQPFVPMAAFPGNVIIDRQGRIRWREYGADMSLTSIRNAIEDVLARPDP
jgi:hypothetical protein